MPRATLDLLRSRLPSTAVFLMYGLTEAFRSTFLPPDQVSHTPGLDRQGNSERRSARGPGGRLALRRGRAGRTCASRRSLCPWGTGTTMKKPQSVSNLSLLVELATDDSRTGRLVG